MSDFSALQLTKSTGRASPSKSAFDTQRRDLARDHGSRCSGPRDLPQTCARAERHGVMIFSTLARARIKLTENGEFLSIEAPLSIDNAHREASLPHLCVANREDLELISRLLDECDTLSCEQWPRAWEVGSARGAHGVTNSSRLGSTPSVAHLPSHAEATCRRQAGRAARVRRTRALRCVPQTLPAAFCRRRFRRPRPDQRVPTHSSPRPLAPAFRDWRAQERNARRLF